jgi:hypothetical protein
MVAAARRTSSGGALASEKVEGSSDKVWTTKKSVMVAGW